MKAVRWIGAAYLFALTAFGGGWLFHEFKVWPSAEIADLFKTDRRAKSLSILKGIPVYHLARGELPIGARKVDLEFLGDRYLALTTMYRKKNTVMLVDRAGKVRKTWVFNPRKFGNKTRARGHLYVDLHGALILPDASAIANLEYLGALKLDRCGREVWRLAETHHSIDRTPRGTYWLPARVVSRVKARLTQHQFNDEYIYEIDDSGKILRKIRLLDVFLKNGLESLITMNIRGPRATIGYGDPMHLNDVEELRPEMAAAFPKFKAGDILASARNMNLVLVFDPGNLKIRWKRVGPWIKQHDPDFQPDGSITVFDNHNIFKNDPADAFSSILSTVPGKPGIKKLLDGARYGMFTPVRGKYSLLPDGHIIVTEASRGRVFVVDPFGKVELNYFHMTKSNQRYEINQAEIIEPAYFREGIKCEKKAS